ncbi:MAG: DNA mismatch repair endonuclease MutL [Verrucomicrobiota bacterium]
MGNKIKLLDETVANRIAAGEVIERPASVVKELVENALDAGAKRIEIEIEKGGKSYIRVTDDGHGMDKDDALLCLERHATSKLKSADDLLRIGSYGFRGEALPSIASVARFRLLTRVKEALNGTELKVNGGKLHDVIECGCAKGTTVEIRSLFFHTPGRRKFLRSDHTEWSHIDHYIKLASMVRQDVDFLLIHNGREVARYLATDDLKYRLKQMFGEEWLRNMVAIKASEEGFSIKGLIGKPGVSRSSRHEHFVFVNKRPIHNNAINFALIQGYQRALVRGRFPVVALFLEVPQEIIDVNIHPAKREVRFHDELRVKHFVSLTVQDTLREEVSSPLSVEINKPVLENEDKKPLVVMPPPMLGSSFMRDLPVASSAEPLENKAAANEDSIKNFDHQQDVEIDKPIKPVLERNHDLNVLGVVMSHYIIAEGDSGIVLVDQQAAHERVLFERMLEAFHGEPAMSQKLLLPLTLDFLASHSEILIRQADALDRMGIGISSLGGDSFMVDALPSEVEVQNAESFVRGIVEELDKTGGSKAKSRVLEDEVIARVVSQRAVRGKVSLKAEEIDKLLKDLHVCELPYTCPQGRPTMIHIGRNELQRKFGR